MQADRYLQQDKVWINQMDQIVKGSEQETKKLGEERVMEERAVKECFEKIEIKMNFLDKKIVLLEMKNGEAELNTGNDLRLQLNLHEWDFRFK